MEIAELSREAHPFYFGTQFHPEFKSRPSRPSPPFFAFAAAASGLCDQVPLLNVNGSDVGLRKAHISEAGVLWRQHEAMLKQETVQACVYSPASSTFKRRKSSSPHVERIGTGSSLSSPQQDNRLKIVPVEEEVARLRKTASEESLFPSRIQRTDI